MKKFWLILGAFVINISAFSQETDADLQKNAVSYIRTGDFDNAIVILSRLIENGNKEISVEQDLILAHYYKRDYKSALEKVKTLTKRTDIGETGYQIAGNVYKAVEAVKECQSLYKTALKKYPNSGPLLSEYGELLVSVNKSSEAIKLWEEGIKKDPAYAGNYYNAALHYFNTTNDKTWSVIYGEIYVNMEGPTPRAKAMKELLLTAYKEKLFAGTDLLKDEKRNKNDFSLAFLNTMNKQNKLINSGVTIESLTMARSRFVLDWFNEYADKFPFFLFEYQRQLLQDGLFDAYNQWLFGSVQNEAAYNNWQKENAEQANAFQAFKSNRVFKMPKEQYYGK